MPIYGSALDHHQAGAVIDIAPDRQTALARYRTASDYVLNMTKDPATQQVIYEMKYIRQDGKWKIEDYSLCIYAQGTIANGFAHMRVFGTVGALDPTQPIEPDATLNDMPGAGAKLYPENPAGFDALESSEKQGCFPARSQVMIHSEIPIPFHFPNPVTGKPVVWINK
jgi:hypothetical protein